MYQVTRRSFKASGSNFSFTTHKESVMFDKFDGFTGSLRRPVHMHVYRILRMSGYRFGVRACKPKIDRPPMIREAEASDEPHR